MIYLDWLLTLSLILVAPIVSLAVSNFQRLITDKYAPRSATHRRSDREPFGDLCRVSESSNHSAANNMKSNVFAARNDDFFGAYMKLTQFIQTQPLVVSTIMVAAVVGIMWLSVREVLVGRLDTGKVFMYWGLLVNLMNPMNRVAAFFGDISKAIVGAGRVFELLDLPVEGGDPADAFALPPVRGRIEFVNVTFRYKPDDAPALHDVNAIIGAGEIVALVGPSGAGKTTLVNLVPRFYQPQEGSVLLDGINIVKARLTDLRDAIAIVPQDVQLFRASILDNIRYGRLGATDEEVLAAAGDANVDEYARQFPEGYRDRGRRAGSTAFGRSAPAHCHRSSGPAKSADSDSRRGDERVGQPLRSADRRGARSSLAGAHDADHRASAYDHSTRAQGAVHRSGTRRRDGDARRIAGTGRPLCSALHAAQFARVRA